MQARPLPLLTALSVAALTLSTPAAAHTALEHATMSSFWAGLMHPLGGIDHLLATLALGLWAALATRTAQAGQWQAPAAFTLLLALGASLAMAGWGTLALEPLWASSLLASGLWVATRYRLPGTWSTLGAGVFALAHGLAHGPTLVASAQPGAALAGLLLAASTLLAGGFALGYAMRHARPWTARMAGAILAGMGLSLLAALA